MNEAELSSLRPSTAGVETGGMHIPFRAELAMPKIETTQVVCVAEFFAKEGKADHLIAALHALMEPTHKEPGCIRYELNQRVDDPRWITYIEKWKDRTAFDTHCGTSYITHFFDVERPDLVETFEVKLYQEILP
jgi:quinol monooxygenase YgiN